MKTLPSSTSRSGGSAIVITLSILVLVTVLAVGLFSVLTTERIAANGAAETARSRSLTQLAADHAISLIRTATATGTTGKFWSSQPGGITVFNADGSIADTVPLISGQADPADDSSLAVNLNQPSFGGNYPIASPASVGSSGSNAPVMKAKWIYLKSGAAAGSGTIGRYAFWVDDESAKININTADGTQKDPDSSFNADTSYSYPSNGFGPGTPTEVSLRALKDKNEMGLSLEDAIAIATQTGANAAGLAAGAKPRLFNDPSEILQIEGVRNNTPTLFEDNNFSLTTYNRSSELNIFGEPKIFLATTESSGAINHMVGPYTWDGSTPFSKQPLSGNNTLELYPTSSSIGSYNYGQLPAFRYTPVWSGTAMSPIVRSLPQSIDAYCIGPQQDNFRETVTSSDYYAIGMRIAKYLSGTNSQGNPITWPKFPGSDPSFKNFRDKYTDRQIDSIALQITDLLARTTYVDSQYAYNSAGMLTYGYLSNDVVIGRGLNPFITEVVMTFETFDDTPPSMTIQISLEWYMPKNYPGWPNGPGGELDLGRAANQLSCLNWQDLPKHMASYVPGSTTATFVASEGGGLLGGSWQDNMLKVLDASDPTDPDPKPVTGFDFWGNPSNFPDLDQDKAAIYHPNLTGTGAYAGKYMGSGPESTADMHGTSALYMFNFGGPWQPGNYHCSYGGTRGGRRYPFRWWDEAGIYHSPLLSKKLTKIRITGGVSVWTHTSTWRYPIDPVPLDCEHGTAGPGVDISMFKDAVATPSGQITDDASSSINPNIKKMRQMILDSVIPITADITIPGKATVVMEVADPMVNKFPGDWKNVSSLKKTMPEFPTSGMNMTCYPKEDKSAGMTWSQVNGDNHGYRDNNGGASYASNQSSEPFWLSPGDTNRPKTQRFPSSGFLQTIHTGIFPDKAVEAAAKRADGTIDMLQMHGTPFRVLNFAPSTDGTSQKTDGGLNYPDWAMLDLFTTPSSFQPAYQSTETNIPQTLHLTWGGATTGRLNPNGAIVPFSSINRTTPLEGILKNIPYNMDPTNSYATLLKDDESTTPADIAKAINSYVAGLGRPLMMAAEICNVPQIAALAYPNEKLSPSNDVVRQIVGNLSTRSNTFTVWAVGQTLDKKMKPKAESRVKYVIERYIDNGVDGLPGNSSSKGDDGVIGTVDDTIDSGTNAYNPAMGVPTLTGASYKPNYGTTPSYPLCYKYRVISATQF